MKFFILIMLAISLIASTLPSNFTKAKEMSVRLYHTNHLKTFYTESDLKPIVLIRVKKFPYKSTLTLSLGLVQSPYQGEKYV
jgi:hypothetical protein